MNTRAHTTVHFAFRDCCMKQIEALAPIVEHVIGCRNAEKKASKRHLPGIASDIARSKQSLIELATALIGLALTIKPNATKARRAKKSRKGTG